MAKANQTQTFLGDETTWSAVHIELSDVQGLWGGRSIFVSGTGRVVVQVVTEGMYERRYEFALTEAEVRRLLQVCIANDLLTIRIAERMGIPDEARPEIALVNAAGERWTLAKWQGVRNARFDAIYAGLLGIETLTRSLEPVYSGPFMWEYVPEGKGK